MKIKATLVVAAAAFVMAGFAQTHDHSQHQQKPAMDMHKCMMDMEAAQARLDALVAKMKSSQGADRIDATANVVAEMVAQEKKMHDMCMQMCMQMMDHPQAAPAKHKEPAKKDAHAGHHAG